MYSAKQIADFVIDYCVKKNYQCSNLRLQKILYFIQAYFLRIKGEPCFCDDIEAWDFGPVVPPVYREYMHYGGAEIFAYDKPTIQFLNEKDKTIVEHVIELLAPYSNTQLVKMTQHQSPWLKNYHGRARVIPIQDIQEFATRECSRH